MGCDLGVGYVGVGEGGGGLVILVSLVVVVFGWLVRG